MITRREHLCAMALLPGAPPEGAVWNAGWDRAVLAAAVARMDADFDPREAMLRSRAGAEYRYHTSLRSQEVHPTRNSLEYALLLLEAGGEGRARRAQRIIERLLALQETDPASKWYGLWGYYLEEPAPKMAPADWNWADFNGSLLLLIEGRHRERLPAGLRNGVREAIRHAAASVRRRNVAMTYTNIAIQGTFVTLAAAELLGDADLLAYATDRLRRFAATVDLTGSFAEYNSPTYANVSILNLTRIRMMVKEPDALRRAERIHHRAWLHLAKHWHAPTRQLAGPMSRCYSTDIGAPLWLQKALGGRLRFASLEEVRSGAAAAPGEVALLDYRCPEDLVGYFLDAAVPRQHREVFLPAEPPVEPVQGTTWLERDYCLGSVNRGDFWVQRRPLLAYWGGPARPARWLQMRFMKDDYDFSSALLFTVQERGFVAGLVNFRSPGGDKHVSLDPIRNGEFAASSMRLRIELANVAANARVLVDGKPAAGSRARLAAGASVAVDLGGAKLWFQTRRAVFGDRSPYLLIERREGVLAVAVELLGAGAPVTVRWREVPEAYLTFTLAMAGPEGSLEEFGRRCPAMECAQKAAAGVAALAWKTPAGELSLSGATAVAAVDGQNKAFHAALNGKPVPLERLSEEKLA